MRRRLRGLMRKEFIHIFRDWRSLMIILLMPITMIILYGNAIKMELRNIRFAVLDDSYSPESRSLVESFARNGFFVHVRNITNRDSVEHLFRRREISMALIIPRDFSERLVATSVTPVQLLVDASDANVGTYIRNYSDQVLSVFNQQHNGGLPLLYNVEPRILYNPALESTTFFVPGLVALILLLISALLTSIAITREKETGTMEQILVSPVHPIEIVLGKVLPYASLGFFNGAMIVLCAWLFFDVPVHGSLLLLTGLSLLYIIVALSFGLMISTVAKTQQIAMLMTLMATVLPTIMISGFLFPIASMPYVLQLLSKVVPATHFLIIIRGIMLKGVGLTELWLPTISLIAIGLFVVTVSVKRFRMRLE